MTFDEILKTLPEKVLKRPLSESERNEILEISSAIGMSTVEEYLYLLLTFKLNEDKLGEKIAALADTEKNINSTLKSIESALKDGTTKGLNEVSSEMAIKLSENIASEALKASGEVKEYQQLRGQILTITAMLISMTAGYALGAIKGLAPIVGTDSFLYIFLALPVGWFVVFCSATYGLLWSYDNWKLILKTTKGKAILAVQILILLWFLMLMI